jgi:Fis family transcriptional regulator, factor for inversion stimulation protein
VMNCVEKPLIETVMHHADGNQTRAADLLGINRNTLRKKILEHDIK